MISVRKGVKGIYVNIFKTISSGRFWMLLNSSRRHVLVFGFTRWVLERADFGAL